MEFFLTVIMCSAIGNVCLPPYTFPDGNKNAYECMIRGYEESKKVSWQILYGNVSVTEKENPFFYTIEKMSGALWRIFNSNKSFKSHIYKRQFVSDQISDPNKNKVLNYFIQSYETENNIETIKKINKYLND